MIGHQHGGDDQNEEACDGAHLLEEQAALVDALAECIQRAGRYASTDEGDQDHRQGEWEPVPDDELQEIGGCIHGSTLVQEAASPEVSLSGREPVESDLVAVGVGGGDQACLLQTPADGPHTYLAEIEDQGELLHLDVFVEDDGRQREQGIVREALGARCVVRCLGYANVHVCVLSSCTQAVDPDSGSHGRVSLADIDHQSPEGALGTLESTGTVWT